MTKNKPISPRKNDIIFFDIATGHPVCSFNQCRHKFTIESTQTVTNNPVVDVDDNNKFVRVLVQSNSHFHQCSECGRKISNKNDRKQSIDSYKQNKHKVLSTRGMKKKNDTTR